VPRIAEALGSLQVTSITIDGEGVVCGPDGVADFDRFRAAVGRKGSEGAFLYVFDLLELDGEDLRREPWEVRRDALASLLRNSQLDANFQQGIRLSEHIDGADGDIVFWHACKLGLEGIVAKRRDRPYRSGRSADWIKIKNPNAPAATRLREDEQVS
jgi:bifunctional non-homologous end joining protein LigD